MGRDGSALIIAARRAEPTTPRAILAAAAMDASTQARHRLEAVATVVSAPPRRAPDFLHPPYPPNLAKVTVRYAPPRGSLVPGPESVCDQ